MHGLCKGGSGIFRPGDGESEIPLSNITEDLEENLKEGLRERAMRWPEARHSIGWVASEKPHRWGRKSRELSRIGSLFFSLLCHFNFADLHTKVVAFW